MKKALILLGIFLIFCTSCDRLSRTREKIAYYDLSDFNEILSTPTFVGIPEEEFLMKALENKEIKSEDFKNYGGGLLEVHYLNNRPVRIMGKYKKQDCDSAYLSPTTNIQNEYTRLEISYQDSTAKLKAYYFDKNVLFPMEKFYYTPYFIYLLNDNKSVKKISLYFQT